MSRVQRRIYKQRREKIFFRRIILMFTLLVILAGLAARLDNRSRLTAEPLLQPTATPIARTFDETADNREITLPACTWYMLQTGVYTDAAVAADKAEEFSSRGAPGFILPDGDRYRVLIAAYPAIEDADSVRLRLKEKQMVDAWVYEWTAPAVTLRLSGMAGQLDIAAAGLRLFDETAARLRDAAIDCDRGTYTLQDLTELLADMHAQTDTWYSTARSRFAEPLPGLMNQLFALHALWQQEYDTLSAADNMTSLSAALKHSAMALYRQCISMRAALLS